MTNPLRAVWTFLTKERHGMRQALAVGITLVAVASMLASWCWWFEWPALRHPIVALAEVLERRSDLGYRVRDAEAGTRLNACGSAARADQDRLLEIIRSEIRRRGAVLASYEIRFYEDAGGGAEGRELRRETIRDTDQ